jgi:hypothetical protein
LPFFMTIFILPAIVSSSSLAAHQVSVQDD